MRTGSSTKRPFQVSDRVNDAYLKANGQENGLRSYGRMVDLLLAYYRDELQ